MFKFKECRERANLTQKEASFALDVSIQSISNWENEVRRPSLEQLIKIAELYKVTTDELLGRMPVPVAIKKDPPPAQPQDGMKRVQLKMNLGDDDTVSVELERKIVEIVKNELAKQLDK